MFVRHEISQDCAVGVLKLEASNADYEHASQVA